MMMKQISITKGRIAKLCLNFARGMARWFPLRPNTRADLIFLLTSQSAEGIQAGVAPRDTRRADMEGVDRRGGVGGRRGLGKGGLKRGGQGDGSPKSELGHISAGNITDEDADLLVRQSLHFREREKSVVLFWCHLRRVMLEKVYQ